MNEHYGQTSAVLFPNSKDASDAEVALLMMNVKGVAKDFKDVHTHILD